MIIMFHLDDFFIVTLPWAIMIRVKPPSGRQINWWMFQDGNRMNQVPCRGGFSKDSKTFQDILPPFTNFMEHPSGFGYDDAYIYIYIYWPARSWLKTWALGGGGGRCTEGAGKWKSGAGKKNVGKMWCSKSKNWCLGLVFDNPFCGVKNG